MSPLGRAAKENNAATLGRITPQVLTQVCQEDYNKMMF
jgi:hypothetical protein